MEHDFRQQEGEAADRFLSWLEQETIDHLRRCVGDPEAMKGAIFLYANRAYESHMPGEQIGALFGKALVRAGGAQEDEEAAFDLLEHFAQIAQATHRQSNPSADSQDSG